MTKILKKYFIPHSYNNFHPHILHTKRAVFYSLFFLLTKIIIVAFVLFLPVEVFVLPDVLAEEQKQIVALTNKIRQEKKLPPLAVISKLDLSAQHKADDMAEKNYFAHVNNKKGLANWLKSVDYNYEVAGENLAVGFNNAQEVVTAWQNSATHYANLIDPEFKDLGVGLSGGVYNGHATIFIAQHLGTAVAVAKVEKAPAKKVVVKKPASVGVKTEAPAAPTAVAVDTQATPSVLSGKIKSRDKIESPVFDFYQPTPVDKYLQAKRVLSPITNIFSISQHIYLIAMIFFVFALLLNIMINFRKQRYQVIAQTSGLIVLLFAFWKF